VVRNMSARVGALAGLLFVGVEMGRQALASPPIDGTAAEMIAYANEHERLLRIFPWVDGVGATCFLLFALVLVTRIESPAHAWLARVATAGATLTFGASLMLDAFVVAYTKAATGATPDAAPGLLIGASGAESVFPYVLAAFLIPVGAIIIVQGSYWTGWAAVAIGVAFPASNLVTAISPRLELEVPLFMALIVWIGVQSLALALRASRDIQEPTPALSR
jgi:hypothetical protein